MDVSVRRVGGSDLTFFFWVAGGGDEAAYHKLRSDLRPDQSIFIGEDMGVNAVMALDGPCIWSVLLNGGISHLARRSILNLEHQMLSVSDG
jgi:hypothetical protein